MYFGNLGRAEVNKNLYCSACKTIGLKKGVNLFNWFMGPNIYAPSHTESYMTDEKLAKLKQLGFTHVRLPVSDTYIANLSSPTFTFNPKQIALLDQAIQQLTSQKMGVVLTLFPLNDTKKMLATDNTFVASYAMLWKELAKRYSLYSPSLVYFELINEPGFQVFLPKEKASVRSQEVQKQLLSAVRSITAQHYVLLTSYDADYVQSVASISETINDPKIIYTVHFYDPIAFTHQGMPIPYIQSASKLPYPVEQTECFKALSVLPLDVSQHLMYYCYTKFNSQEIDRQFQLLVTWANSHHVALYLGEFGAHQNIAPPGDTEQWIKDVREASERYGIPWAFWSAYGPIYDFSITGSQGQFYSPLLKALGMEY